MSMNNCVDHHHALLDNNLKFRHKAEELIRRYESRFEPMEMLLVKKSNYIKLLKMNLATLTSRIDMLEDKLCHCGD